MKGEAELFLELTPLFQVTPESDPAFTATSVQLTAPATAGDGGGRGDGGIHGVSFTAIRRSVPPVGPHREPCPL